MSPFSSSEHHYFEVEFTLGEEVSALLKIVKDSADIGFGGL